MKPHLPTSLFRQLMLIICAAPAFGADAGMSTPGAIATPEGYTVVNVSSASDMSSHAATANVAFKIAAGEEGVVMDELSTSLKTGSGNWYITSADASNLSSLSITNAATRPFSSGSLTVENLAALTATGITFTAYSDYNGGAFSYMFGTSVFNNNGTLYFADNSRHYDSRGNGGVFYVANSALLTFSHNNDITFDSNYASSLKNDTSGGAIYGKRGAKVSFENNKKLSFTGNKVFTVPGSNAYITAYAPKGGAIHIEGSENGGSVTDGEGYIAITGNDDVLFQGNISEADLENQAAYNAYGGAIYAGNGAGINLSSNKKLTFDANKVRSATRGSSTTLSAMGAMGGAIAAGDGATVQLNNNEQLSFRSNEAFSGSESASSSTVYGGAIYLGKNAVMDLNSNASLDITGNAAISQAPKSGSYCSAYGGAIYGGDGSIISLNDNATLNIQNNKAYSEHGSAYGGAISGGTVNITGNTNVIISGNQADGAKGASWGGAIHAQNVTISGNSSVLIENNAEIDASGTRLLAIRAEESLNLSAGANQTIRVHDTVKALGSVQINTTQNNSGSVIFDASKVATHLENLLGRAATAEEIRTSSTSLFGETTQKGGTLQVQSGARVLANSYTIDTSTGTQATLALHSGKFRTETLTAGSGSSLAFSGDAYALFKESTLADSTVLHFTPTLESNVRLAGNINAGELTISIDADQLSKGQSFCLFTLAAGSSLAWDESKVTLEGVSAEDARLVWNKGSLYLDYGVTTGGTQESMLMKDGYVLSEEYREVNQQTVSQLSTAEGSQKFVLTENVTVDNQNLAYDALIGHYELTAADAEAPVNLTIQNLKSASMGSRSAASYIWIHHLDQVQFLNNQATESGCSMYLYSGSTAEISDNNSVSFISYPDTLSEAQSPQIYVGGNSTLRMENNKKILFANNYGRFGAAIQAAGNSLVEIAHNQDVEFTGNGYTKANNNSYVDYGGAIRTAGAGAEIALHNNKKVSFNNNICEQGGAIALAESSKLSIYDNEEVSFTGNGRPGEGSGGAIALGRYATLEITGNKSVSFDKNEPGFYGSGIYGETYSSVRIEGNDNISFTENIGAGGAGISMETASSLIISGNKNVIFDSNKKTETSNGGSASAIRIFHNGSNSYAGNIVEINNNENLRFTYNEGAAIRMSNLRGSLSIQNNDSAVFEGNYAVDTKGNYTLQAMRIGAHANAVELGAVTDISLSAAQGKSLDFRDGINITGNVSVSLNNHFTTAENQSIAQTGDIVFSSANVEKNLIALKGSKDAVTADEIKNSSTFNIEAQTKLHGGRLRVEDGAIFTGHGLEATAGSAATVLVNNATIDHTGYDLIFNSGTRLEVIGKSSVLGNLVMKAGSAMVVDAAIMSLSGTTSIGDEVSLSSRNTNAAIAKLAMASDGITGSAKDSGMQDVTLAVGNATYFLTGMTLNNVELNTSANTAFTLTDVAVQSGSSFNLGSSGSVVMHGKGLYDIGSATTMGSRISLDNDWTGTVRMTGSTLTGLNLDSLAKGDNSSVELSGVKGYLNQANETAQTYAANLILTDNGDKAAWEINNGWSGDTRTFTGTISGEGSIRRTTWNGTKQNLIFAGDTSQWDGVFSHEVDKGAQNGVTIITNLTFNGSSEINAEITTNGKGELNVTLDDANIKTRATEVKVNKQMSVTSLTLTEGTNARFSDTLTSAAESTINKDAHLSLGESCTLSGYDGGIGTFAGTVLSAEAAEGGSMSDMNVALAAGDFAFEQIELSNVHFASTLVSTLTLNDVNFGDDCSFDVGATGSIALSGATLTLTTPALSLEHDGMLVLDCSDIFHCTASGDLVISLGLTREELMEAGYTDISVDFGTDVDYTTLALSIDGAVYTGVQNGAATFTLVPEPATATLSLLALAALAARRRRK